MPFLCNKKSCTDHWQSGHIFLYFYYWAFMKSSLRRKQVDPARLLVPLHGAGTARGSKASQRFYPRKPIGGVGHLYPGHPTLRFPLVVAAGWECNAFRRKIGKEVSTLVSWNGHAGELQVFIIGSVQHKLPMPERKERTGCCSPWRFACTLGSQTINTTQLYMPKAQCADHNVEREYVSSLSIYIYINCTVALWIDSVHRIDPCKRLNLLVEHIISDSICKKERLETVKPGGDLHIEAGKLSWVLTWRIAGTFLKHCYSFG